jgi:hypothetical protein
VTLLAALLFLAVQAAEPPPAAVSERPSASRDPEALKSETPAAEAAAPLFDPVTKVDGKTLQVVFGARAVFHLNDDGAPVLDKAEKGQLAIAHPAGTVKEEFEAPETGQIAIALDGSAEKKASYLKVWNGLDYPVVYRAGILMLQGGKLVPKSVRVCAVPAGKTGNATWPGPPVVAIALGSFTKAAGDTACQ